MKVKKIHFQDHKVLKNLEIDFTENDKVKDLTIIAGINGSGKTNVLKYVYEYFSKSHYNNNNLVNSIEFLFEEEEKKIEEKLKSNFMHYLGFYEYCEKNNSGDQNFKLISENLKVLPKIIYIPAEINFTDVATKTNMLKRKYNFLNVVDSELISNIASYIATRITYVTNTQENLTGKQVKEKVAKEINEIFEILDLDIEFIGLSKDEESMPLFKNSLKEEFNINELSSGEKQLFIRTLAIKMLEPENSIILIDEPELSLHPKWQQKIVEVYKKIGKNNQIIIATHSPHILGSVRKESIILLTRGERKEIKVLKSEDLDSSLGQPVDRILEDIMGLETTRTPEIFNKINKLRELVDKYEYESAEFKSLFKEMIDILGATDEDMILIKMDVNIMKKQKEQRGE
ncbi:MAG: AAA family ATPase [Fusobacteriaceae bacterium]